MLDRGLDVKKTKNEKFIEHWNSARRKGKKDYIFIHGIRYIIAASLTIIAISLYTGDDINFRVLIGVCIGGLIGSILVWHANEKKYNEIINDKKE